MRVIGHRGAAGHAPENTLLSIEKALSLGAGWVEVDVRISSDGIPVVIHDGTLVRTTGAPGRVADSPLNFLRSLDAGGSERIPLAREVLERLRGRAGLNLEIKDSGAGGPLCDLLRWALAGGWEPRDLLVSSFGEPGLKTVREAVPQIPLGLLVARIEPGLVRRVRGLGAGTLGLPVSSFRREFGEACHREGLRVLAFTANEPEVILRLRDSGADGIFTDFPDRALGALAQAANGGGREPRAGP